MGNSDSRAEFRGLVQTLIEDDVLPIDSDLWNVFWKLPASDEDVFMLIQPEDVRSMATEQVRILVWKGLEKLKVALELELENDKLPDKVVMETMNAVRILTRVLPFVLERGKEQEISALFWSIEDDQVLMNGGLVKTSLGHGLIDAIGRLLFLPGLTLPGDMEKPEPNTALIKSPRAASSSSSSSSGSSSVNVDDKRNTSDDDDDTDYDGGPSSSSRQNSTTMDDQSGIYYLNRDIVWSAGVGTLGNVVVDGEVGGPEYIPMKSSKEMDRRRFEILRLLLVCQSEILFETPDECVPERNNWIRATAIHDVDNGMPFCRELLCSLLNQVMNYDPVGWGIPYGGTVSRSGVEHANFVDICLHNLLVFLEVNSWGNVYKVLLSEIQHHEEFEFLYDNIVRLLKIVPDSKNSLLPGSQGSFESYQELLILLWKLVDSNNDFMNYILKSCDINQVMTPICYLMWEGRKSSSKVGLMHICTFVLLLLSGERNFGVALNRPYPQNLPLKGAPKMSNANHGDLLVVVFSKLIFDGNKRLSTLYNCFLTVLSNFSPYIKSFGKIASIRLLSLFDRFSMPSFLMSGENHHQYLYFLLDIFNNVIQYQYEGNSQLVYTLCNHEEKIRKLHRLRFSDVDEKIIAKVREEEGFVPTKEWFDSWKSKLPIHALVRMLDILVPQIEVLNKNGDGALSEDDIIHFIKDSTMVGLLPVPHPIVIRRYQPNQYTTLWFTTYSLGVIFLKHQAMPLWDGNKIKLFQINLVSS